ncbi:hypothetical protein FAP59_17495 [Morganella morganii]|nr:hypothetical protein [Morganella morganii]
MNAQVKTREHPAVLTTLPSSVFPLVLVFSTGSHFCLHIAGHYLFDKEQQRVIAEMQPTYIRLDWHTASGDVILRVGRYRRVLGDGDITVYRFSGRRGSPPQEADWDRLLYRIFKGETPGAPDWVCQPFLLSALRCHSEFFRLTCRGAILAGAGGIH